MTLHISHNDLDGIACGILVKAAFPAVYTMYLTYDDLEPTLEELPMKYNHIIITDVAPSEALVGRIAGERELTLIDHHVSSQVLKKYPFVVHTIGKSATLLTYEWLMGMNRDVSAYENFVRCVDDFDLWTMKRPDSLRMNLLFTLLGASRFEKRFFAKPYESFLPEEELLITLEEERRDHYIMKAMKNLHMYTDPKGLTFTVVFAEMYTSELGNRIIANGVAEYVLIINAQRKKVSLRSHKDVDISEIAVRNGGGGHKNAAGFNLPTDFNLTNILKQLEMI